MICTKYSVLFVAVSLVLVLSFSGSETEAKSLSYRPKLMCVGNLQKVCNFLGNYCHAEVLSGRKRRSVLSSSEPGYMSRKSNKPKRRRVKIKVRLTGKCKLCAHYCW